MRLEIWGLEIEFVLSGRVGDCGMNSEKIWALKLNFGGLGYGDWGLGIGVTSEEKTRRTGPPPDVKATCVEM